MVAGGVALSIIVPVYNVAPFIGPCLDSILGQTQPRALGAIEVIAVDDRSPDSSGAILDAYAARDGRVRVIHLDRNVGLGPARNIGMQHASGDYLAFLDGDDTFTDHALRLILDRVSVSERPDVVVFDHARTFWDGRIQPSPHAALLARLSGSPFTAEQHPEIFDLLQVAWNKVYRREFVEEQGLAFPPGYYEDTAWTHVALLSARSVVTLPEVCVHYRQRRHGSILTTSSSKHFEAFDQWQRLFDHLATHPELEHWRPLLARRAVDHYTSVLTLPGRVPSGERGRFFAQAASAARTNYGSSIPVGHLKARLLTTVSLAVFDQAYRARSTVARMSGVSRTGSDLVRTVTRRAARLGRNGARLVRYRQLRREPLDPQLAVYSALWNRGVSGNPAAIYEAMRQVAPQVAGVWVVAPEHQPGVPAGIDVVTPLSRRYFELIARATYFVNDVNFPDYLVKRPGQVHVQTQHGTPLKHMGLDLMAHPLAAKGMNFTKLLARADRWDYNLSANPFSSLVWQRAFPSGFTTLESGYPRNDVLVTATAQDVAAARRALGVADDATTVLYAPTHRDTDTGFTARIDLDRFAEALGPDVVVLVRTHYYYPGAPDITPRTGGGRIIDVSRHPRVEPLLLAADVLVTDYSSIMFDYANLDRPIVSFVPDWEEYRSVRGVYFDLLACPPGVTVTDADDLADVIRSGAHDSAAAAATRQSFRSEFCTFDDGRAAERVARTVFAGEPLLPMIPLEQRVPAPRSRTDR